MIGDRGAFQPVSGVVSLPHIADHVFELQSTMRGNLRVGDSFSVHAEAVHPLTRKAIRVTSWKTLAKVGDRTLSPVRVETPDTGPATFYFTIPSRDHEEAPADFSVGIEARVGDFEQSVSIDQHLATEPSARIQTDKPIYQPGQTIHFRAVVVDPQGKPLRAQDIRFQDGDSQAVHTAMLKTSRFGVIQEEWALPVGAVLGTYSLELSAEDRHVARHLIRVSRYELPSFTVSAKPDRATYQNDQTVLVTVSAAYLYGKPLANGAVRIIRNREPRWNPKTRKSEATDETVAEGQSDTSGNFTVGLDLKAEQRELQGNKSELFDDVHFSAFVKDPLSGKTEQRRFDVRLTREAIHVRLISAYQSSGPIYLSTSYADGRPAAAAVVVRHDAVTFQLRTNRYGVGKFELPPRKEDYKLSVTATDSRGETGSLNASSFALSVRSLDLMVPRTLYRAGESVTVRFRVPESVPVDSTLLVFALSEQRRLAHRLVRLANREGEVTFPWQPEFRRAITFDAWCPSGRTAGIRAGARTVFFPDGNDISVTAIPDRATYRPGDQATLRMQVKAMDGKPVEAAIGVAVVDQAVSERARTDAEFGQRSWFSCLFCGDFGERELGGIRLNDLYALKPDAVLTPDLDLVAEALAADFGPRLARQEGETLAEHPPFENITHQVEKMSELLDRHYNRTLEFPKDSTQLDSAARSWLDLRDPWGRPYRVEFDIDGDSRVIRLFSAGPDKQSGTSDDFLAGSIQKPWFAPSQFLIGEILSRQQDFPGTEAEARTLFAGNGIMTETLRDVWGEPIRLTLSTEGRYRRIVIRSVGPDRQAGTHDDLFLATFSGSYFSRETAAIQGVLVGRPAHPQTVDEFSAAVRDAGIDLNTLRDAWGAPYRVSSHAASRYNDRIQFSTTQVFGGTAVQRRDSTPVTQHYLLFSCEVPDGTAFRKRRMILTSRHSRFCSGRRLQTVRRRWRLHQPLRPTERELLKGG